MTGPNVSQDGENHDFADDVAQDRLTSSPPPGQVPPAPIPGPGSTPAATPGENHDFADDVAADRAQPPSTTPGPSDQKQSQLRASVTSSMGTNPDAAAKSQQLAADAGVPADVAARNPEQVSALARDKAIDYPQLTHDHPGVAQYLADPKNAVVSHDDIDNLKHVDLATRMLAHLAATPTPWTELDQPASEPDQAPLPIMTGVIGRGLRSAIDQVGTANPLITVPAIAQHVYRWLAGADQPENYKPPASWTPLGAIYSSKDLIAREQAARATYQPSTPKDVASSLAGLPIQLPTMIGLPVLAGENALARLGPMATETTKAAKALIAAVGTQAAQSGGSGLESSTEGRQQAGGGASLQASDVVNAGAQAALATVVGRAAGLVGPLAHLRGEPLALGDIPRDLAVNQAAGGVQSAAGSIIQGATSGNGTPAPGDIAQSYAEGAIPGFLLSLANVPGARAYSRAQDLIHQTILAQQARDAGVTLAQGHVAAQLSKTAQRAPDNFQQLVQTILQHTGMPNTGKVFFQAEDWDKHWESHGGPALPEDMATSLTGDKDAYFAAKATGAPIGIPLDAYQARIQGTEHGEALMEHARLQPEGMTLKEANDFFTQAPGELKDIGATMSEEIAKSAETDPTGEGVKQSIIEQAILAGHDPAAAENVANLHQAFHQQMAALLSTPERPLTAQAMQDRFPLTVSHEVPQAIQGTPVDHLDVAINRIRSGEVHTQNDIFGQSLNDFLRERGGVRDDNGDLKHTGADAPKPFSKKLVNAKGMAMDEAAEAAHEAGYLRNRDINELTTKIADELHGKQSFADQNTNHDMLGAANAQKELHDFLKSIGADPAHEKDNAVIKAKIEAAQKGMPEAAPRYMQAAWHGKIVRGYFTPKDGAGGSITFTPNANLSTFLHESSHYFMHVLSQLAKDPAAAPSLVKDLQTLRDWMGVKPGEEMTEAHHEQLATALETYFMRGKAPTVALRPVFQRFKAWLNLVYKRMLPYKGLISDEVHSVFDRLFASDHEIAAAQERAGFNNTLPRSQWPAGPEGDQGFTEYHQAVARAQEAAESTLRTQLMRALQQEHTARFQEEREQVRSKITDDINNRPIYTVIHALQDGTLADGTRLPDEFQGMKLSRADLLKHYDAESLSKLPGPSRLRDADGNLVPKANRGRPIYSVEGGMKLSDMAEAFGYKSGDELFQALTAAPDRRTLIESETDAKMRALHPDPLLDGSIAQRADDAIANEERGKLLTMEVNRLASAAGKVATPRQLLAIAAKDAVGHAEAGTLRPDIHRAAEARASKLAFEAVAAGDHKAAFLHKQQELLNHELHAAAVKAKAQVEKIRAHMQELGKPAARSRIGKAGGWEWTVTSGKTHTRVGSEEEAKALAAKTLGATWERTSSYLDQLDTLRGQYEFANVSKAVLERRQTWAAFIQEQHELGLAPDLPPELRDPQTTPPENWKALTVDQLTAIHDAAKNIEAMAKFKNQLMDAAREQSLNDLVAGMEESIRTSNVTTVKAPKSGTSTWSTLTDPINRALNAWKRVPDIIYRIDGHKTGGVLSDGYQRPLNEAGDQKMERTAQSTKHFNDLLDTWGKMGPGGIHNMKLNTPMYIPEVGRSYNIWSIMKMAMDFGSSGNRERLMENNGWDEGQTRAVLNRMDAKDVALVNGIVEHINSFRSEIGALEQRTKGVAPKWVDGLPYDVAGGHLKGGYSPIQYDTVNHPGLRLTEDQAAKNLMGGRGAAAMYTAHNHTEARTGNAGIPLSTDFGDIASHLSRVIHDLTMREAVMDANRVLKRIAPTLNERYGINVVPQFQAQLHAIAAGGVRIENDFAPIIGMMRQGANAGVRAFNVAGFFQQLAGLPFVVPRTNAINAFRAIGPAFNPLAHISLEHSSIVMRYRNAERGRILNEAIARTSTFAPLNGFRNTAYMFLNTAWKILDCHAWHAAYFKAQASYGEDEAKCRSIADQEVASTQGATDAKDMSEIMRGGESWKLLTNNMSWANANFNLMLLSMQRYVDKGGTWNPASNPQAAGKMVADMLVYSIVCPAVYLAVHQALTQSQQDLANAPGKTLLREAAYNGLSAFPVARDIAPAIEHDNAQFSGPQGASFEGIIFNALSEGVRQAEANKSHSHAAVSPTARTLLDLSGVITHFPADQVKHMIAGWHAAQSHHMNPILPTLFGAPEKPKRTLNR